MRDVRLADGARVQLNTASAMDVRFTLALRRIVLRQGEIQVRTSPDSAMPSRLFVVDTQEGRLVALGTRFIVRQMDGETLVAVFEGAVRIEPQDSGGRIIIPAGRQARFTRSAISAVQPADPAREGWAHGMLVAQDMRLADAIAELARYWRGHLVCAPAVAGIRIVGVYSLTETDRTLAALQATLPVRLRQPLPWWVEVVEL